MNRALYIALIIMFMMIMTIMANQSHEPTPTNFKPLNGVDIRVNFNPNQYQNQQNLRNIQSTTNFHNQDDISQNYFPGGHHNSLSQSNDFNFETLSSFTPLNSLSSDDIKTTSDVLPQSLDDPKFHPFGDFLHFSFKIPSSSQFNPDADDLNINEQGDSGFSTYNFVLEVDENVVSTQPQHPSTSKYVASPTNGLLEQTIGYSTRVSYRGKRLDDLGREETLVLVVLSNGGQFDHLYNYGLDTQNINDSQFPQRPHISTLSMDQLSGRQDAGYTVEGVLFAGDGKMYQISSYRTQLFQHSLLKDTLNDQLSEAQRAYHEQSTLSVPGGNQMDAMEMITAAIEEISEVESTIELLYSQQVESSYDLSIAELDFDGGAKGCVADDLDDQSDDEKDDLEGTRSLSMKPLWAFSKWDGCHKYINTTTIFKTNLWLAINYQIWASSATDTSGINNDMVDARVQLFMSLSNTITEQQLSVAIGLNEIYRYSPSDPYGGVNTDPAGSCDISLALDDFTNDVLANKVPATAAANHNIQFCKSYVTGSGTGVAWTRVACRNLLRAGGAVSSFQRANTLFFGTFVHENGHGLFGIKHPFNGDSALQGHFGGIMDYKNTRLDDSNENDKRKGGFNRVTDYTQACPWLTELFEGIESGSNRWIAQSSCVRPVPNTVTTMTMTNYDGIVDPYESCDSTLNVNGVLTVNNNQCCSKGRFIKEQSNCSIPNECCVNCKSIASSTRCSLSSDQPGNKSGYCQRGFCTSLTCSNAVLPTCTNDGVFFNSYLDTCAYRCPNSCTVASGTVSNWFNFQQGATCVSSTGIEGVCVPDLHFQTTERYYQKCETNLQYTWSHYVIRECSVTNSVIKPVLDNYVCRDLSGFPVSNDFCTTNNVIKPLPALQLTPEGLACNAHCTITNIGTSPTGNVQLGGTMTVNWVYTGSVYYNVNILLVPDTNDSTRGMIRLASNIDPSLGRYVVTIPVIAGVSTSAAIRVRRSDNANLGSISASTFNINDIPIAITAVTVKTPPPIESGTILSFSFKYSGPAGTAVITLASSTDQSTPLSRANVNVARLTAAQAVVYQGTIAIPSLTSTMSNAVIKVTNGETTVASSTFAIIIYSWVLGTSTPQQCPTVICGTTRRVQVYECRDSANALVVENKCQTTKPADVITTCPAPSTTCSTPGGSCVNNACQCNDGFTGDRCENGSVFTQIAVPSAAFDLTSSSKLTLTFVYSGPIITYDVIYRSSLASTDEIKLLTNQQVVVGTNSKTLNVATPAITKSTSTGVIVIKRYNTSEMFGHSNTFQTSTYNWNLSALSPLTCPKSLDCGLTQQTQTYLCQRVVGTSTTTLTAVADIAKCGTKPSNPAPINCPITTTCDRGTCGALGTENANKCICSDHFSGNRCTLAPSFSSITLPLNDQNQIQLDKKDTLKWSYNGKSAKFSLYYMTDVLAVDSVQKVLIGNDISTDLGSYDFTIHANKIEYSKTALLALEIVSDTHIITHQTDSFDTFSYNWVEGTEWNQCSVRFCGTGSQTRQNTCVKSDTKETVLKSLCDISTMPLTSRPCTGPSMCSTNGTCVDDQCQCNNGWNGALCDNNAVCTIDSNWTTSTSTLCDPATTSNCGTKCANQGYITAVEDEPDGSDPVNGEDDVTVTYTCPTEANKKDTCECINFWTTPTDSTSDTTTPVISTFDNPGCTKCSLSCSPEVSDAKENTYIRGLSNQSCSECICRRGFWSYQSTRWDQTTTKWIEPVRSCSCQELYVTLSFSTFPKDYFISDSSITAGNIVKKLENGVQIDQQMKLLSTTQSIINTVISLPTAMVHLQYWRIHEGQLHVTWSIKMSCINEDNSNAFTLTESNTIEIQQEEKQNDREQVYLGIQKALDYLHQHSQPDVNAESVDSGQMVANLLLGSGTASNTISTSVYDPSCQSKDFASNSQFSCSSTSTQSPFVEDATEFEPIPDDPSKGKGIATWILIVVIVIPVVIVLIAIIIICFCCGCLCFGGSGSSSKPTKSTPSEQGSMQMAEVGATYNYSSPQEERHQSNPMVDYQQSQAPQAPPSAPRAPAPPSAPMAPSAPSAPRAPPAPQF